MKIFLILTFYFDNIFSCNSDDIFVFNFKINKYWCVSSSSAKNICQFVFQPKNEQSILIGTKDGFIQTIDLSKLNSKFRFFDD